MSNLLRTIRAMGDISKPVEQFSNTLVNQIRTIALPLGVLFVVAAGILFMVGGDSVKSAKKWIMYIVLGIGIVLLGGSVISGLYEALKSGM